MSTVVKVFKVEMHEVTGCAAIPRLQKEKWVLISVGIKILPKKNDTMKNQ